MLGTWKLSLQPDSPGMGGKARPNRIEGPEEQENPVGPEGARCSIARVRLSQDILEGGNAGRGRQETKAWRVRDHGNYFTGLL